MSLGGGKAPLSLKPFSFWCPTKAANLLHSSYIFNRPPTRVQTHRICINRRNDLWQKWGGHVHLSPPCGDASEFDSLACPRPYSSKTPCATVKPDERITADDAVGHDRFDLKIFESAHHFRIESGGRFEFESNLEASQVPSF